MKETFDPKVSYERLHWQRVQKVAQSNRKALQPSVRALLPEDGEYGREVDGLVNHVVYQSHVRYCGNVSKKSRSEIRWQESVEVTNQ